MEVFVEIKKGVMSGLHNCREGHPVWNHHTTSGKKPMGKDDILNCAANAGPGFHSIEHHMGNGELSLDSLPLGFTPNDMDKKVRICELNQLIMKAFYAIFLLHLVCLPALE
jgi:hypothetical protein